MISHKPSKVVSGEPPRGIMQRSRMRGNSLKPAWVAGVAIVLLLTIAWGAGTRTFSDDNSSGTWSIAAVDADAAEVGVALATCVPDDSKLSTSTVGGSGDDAAGGAGAGHHRRLGPRLPRAAGTGVTPQPDAAGGRL